jgi:hypothetical protein
MIRTPRARPGRTAARGVAGRVLRRVGGTVLAASIGALTTTVVLSLTTGSPAPVEDARTPDRTGERPSRAQPRDTPAQDAAARLLSASALSAPSGALGRESWRTVHTEPHEPRALAASCHRFPLVSVGALRVAHRAYVLGAGGHRSTAVHVVARFADARTAWRAHQVLLSWRAGCSDALDDRPHVRVSAARALPDGALRYAVAWDPGSTDGPSLDERLREDVALTRVGSRVTLVRVTGPASSGGTGVVAAAVRSARGLLER